MKPTVDDLSSWWRARLDMITDEYRASIAAANRTFEQTTMAVTEMSEEPTRDRDDPAQVSYLVPANLDDRPRSAPSPAALDVASPTHWLI